MAKIMIMIVLYDTETTIDKLRKKAFSFAAPYASKQPKLAVSVNVRMQVCTVP